LLGLDNVHDLAARVDQIAVHGEAILEVTGAQIAAITLDRDGALVFERDSQPYRTYATPQPHSRAAGAGDTFVSALALALAAGAYTTSAAELASAASSIVVAKEGTSACTVDELQSCYFGCDKQVTDVFGLAARVSSYRQDGKRVVFTNGCFDILHRGHITYLNQAKSLGDTLILGINSDDSVKRLKGPARPINPLEDRMQVLAALSCIDLIVPFDGDTPAELIKVIRPDVFVKGGDYTRATLPEGPLVESLGGEVIILSYLDDRSTTSMIERIRAAYTWPANSRVKSGVSALGEAQSRNPKGRAQNG
jgi:D-beta-D-heptose 7-phosphate kinase/D-beta-D-heptose 1-phosphate adenosyltransferase